MNLKTIVDFKYIINSQQTQDLLAYTTSLLNWTNDHFLVKFNFENPQLVSTGQYFDMLNIIVESPKYFISNETGEELDLIKDGLNQTSIPI